MKKIYFACSISGGRGQAHVYPTIVRFIQAQGMQVLSELFADPTLNDGRMSSQAKTPKGIWRHDMKWVGEADAIVAEVSQPSLGVGYEIAKAHEWHKPALALYKSQPGKRLSAMIIGSPNVTVFEYQDVAETEAAIKTFLQRL